MPAYLIAEHTITDPAKFEEQRVVIIEFPDMAALNGWYESPEYKPLIALRRASARDMLITLEGA